MLILDSIAKICLGWCAVCSLWWLIGIRKQIMILRIRQKEALALLGSMRLQNLIEQLGTMRQLLEMYSKQEKFEEYARLQRQIDKLDAGIKKAIKEYNEQFEGITAIKLEEI